MSGTRPHFSSPSRRIRRAARILLSAPDGRILLFRFTPEGTAPFWIMPGGECDPDEDFPQAARRELLEETGICADPFPLRIVRKADYEYFGEPVKAVEHFFHLCTQATRIDTSGHTALEQRVMQEHRWFTPAELQDWPETVYPPDILELIRFAAAIGRNSSA